MQALVGIAGVLLLGVFSPGPNNIVVMHQAARRGWRGALPAMLGITCGSAALLSLVFIGAGTALDAAPRLSIGLTALGCLYLTWLGARLLRGGGGRAAGGPGGAARALPAGAIGLFLFQFLNPKAWAIATTAAATTRSTLGPAGLPLIVALFLVISAAGLLTWALLGRVMMRHPSWPVRRKRFDRAMGAVLIACSVVILLGS